MKSKKLEYWSRGVMGGTRNGVREYRSSGVAGSEARRSEEGSGDGCKWERWFGRSVQVGKGALEMGKWTAFPAISRMIRCKSLISRI